MCLSLYLTLHVEVIYTRVDSFFPWNNTALLLSYLCVSWAAYFLNVGMAVVLGTDMPRWMRALPVVATLFWLGFFPFSLARSMPQMADTVPFTIADVLFRQVLYVYMFFLLLLPIPPYLQVMHQEQMSASRLRLALVVMALAASAALAATKIMVGSIGYLSPQIFLRYVLDGLATSLMAIVALLWMLIYLPSQYYLKLVQPFYFLRNLMVLRDLRVVECQIHQLCPPVVADPATRWQQLWHLDYSIHRSLIHILDGRKHLEGYLLASTAHLVSELADDSPLANASFAQVQRLYQQLCSVDADLEYQAMVQAYRVLGQQMRREQQGQSSHEAERTA